MDVRYHLPDRVDYAAVRGAHEVAEPVETTQDLSRCLFRTLERPGTLAWILAGGHERIVGELNAVFHVAERGPGRVHVAFLVCIAGRVYCLIGVLQRQLAALLELRLGLDPGQVHSQEQCKQQMHGYRFPSSLSTAFTRWRAMNS